MKAKVTGDGTKGEAVDAQGSADEEKPAAEGTVEAWANNRMRAL